MKGRAFSGGIHMPHYKEFTYNIPIETIMPRVGQEMVYPMSQHIGAACLPVVNVGERVIAGQKIGESASFISSTIHSSVSGMIIDIRDVLTPGGGVSNAVIIQCDGRHSENRSVAVEKDISRLPAFSKEQILSKIKEAGVVGMGGAGFPTHIKLNPAPEKKIDYIIANGAECEPYITADHLAMLNEADKLIAGLQIIMSLQSGSKGIIAVESNKPDVIALLEHKIRGLPNIEMARLGTKYPQGSERQIIYSCTGRKVPLGGLPQDVGCIVCNVATIMAVYDAVMNSRPLISRIVTISGDGAVNKGNFRVLTGTRLKDLLMSTGNPFDETVRKIICGGPMMGNAVYDVKIPITKTTSAFLLFSKHEAELPAEQACIRCGRCVNACPMGLMPIFLNRDMLTGDIEMFKKGRGFDCIECGSCSYVCPSGRHIVQSVVVGKRGV